MKNDNQRKPVPFAITARTAGHPAKLFTPVTVVNLQPSGKAKIVAVRVNAMWDTGAEVCVMSASLAARLGIKFDKTVETKGLTGNASAVVGYAYISLLANGDLVEVVTGIVDETSLAGEYSFIIGLNFIRKGTLAISSTNIDTTLSFVIPSPEPVDFTKLADIEERFKGYLPLSETTDDGPVLYDADALALIVPE